MFSALTDAHIEILTPEYSLCFQFQNLQKVLWAAKAATFKRRYRQSRHLQSTEATSPRRQSFDEFKVYYKVYFIPK